MSKKMCFYDDEILLCLVFYRISYLCPEESAIDIGIAWGMSTKTENIRYFTIEYA